MTAPAAQTRSLSETAVREGFESRKHDTGFLVVGVDASTWLYECQAALNVRGRTHSRAGQNPELRTLFQRLSILSRIPVSLVFVFDGPARPTSKCNKHVYSTPHWLTSYFREFIEAFGFYVHDAPGEAEAELASLNASNIIDFVLTSDNDVFVFGATHVIRSPQDKKKRDCVDIYVMGSVGVKSAFTHAGFFLIAVLVGGDYDLVGLHGCGPSTACALASTPLARSLLHAATSLSDQELDRFLVDWREHLRHELSEDPNGVLKRRHQSLASAIPNSFPNPKVLRLYAKPAVTSLMCGLAPSAQWTKPGNLDLARIITLVEHRFGWGNDIFNKLLQYIWDGLCLRDMVKSCFPPGPAQTYLGPPAIRYITRTALKIESATAPPSYLVEVWLTAAMTVVAAALEDLHMSASHGSCIISTCVWVPSPIITLAAADRVDDFHESYRKSRIEPSAPYVPVCPYHDLAITAATSSLTDSAEIVVDTPSPIQCILENSAASSSTLPSSAANVSQSPPAIEDLMTLDLTVEHDPAISAVARNHYFIDLTVDDEVPTQSSGSHRSLGKGKEKDASTEIIDLTI
ncbi:Flap endonuclease GEN 1 [Hypsizygus marmoreus]|uniref:Flap endonuclease GEN 1 n=1 Tax=Hypsizygus marmoreus TaxID=39966 RepID=A0A369JHG2_HYPMA|nr:Flap endonuclease GEN 1 [Hypsizygus marmoreus]